jgi:two-component system response regulator FlrC
MSLQGVASAAGGIGRRTVDEARVPTPAERVESLSRDPRSVEFLAIARRVAPTGATVLITGESGCGKEVVARYLHHSSPRAAAPFVAVNCAAIPENLLEATMFGYEKGAFTGATRAQPGKLEQAQGGTLLLDEISEMSLALQAKLLRVLQEREVERVGGSHPIALDVRIVATSNRDLPAAVAKGAFRDDLYYRLSVFPLEIPPLRERVGDILPLAREFLARAAAQAGREGLVFSAGAESLLQAHAWPGNVRELENAVQRAVILASGDAIAAADLRLAPAPVAAACPPSAGEPSAGEPSAAGHDMKSLERTHILETLAAVNGSRKLAVARLGISERTLRYKLNQYRQAGAIN